MPITNSIDELTARLATIGAAKQYIQELGDDLDPEAIEIILNRHCASKFSPDLLHRLVTSDWQGLYQVLCQLDTEWTLALPAEIEAHGELRPDLESKASRIMLVRELAIIIGRRLPTTP